VNTNSNSNSMASYYFSGGTTKTIFCIIQICNTYIYTDLGRAMAQSVSRPLSTAAARAQVRSCWICGGQSGTGAGFLRVLRFPLPIFIPPTAPHSSSITRGGYNRPNSGRRTKWARLTPPQETICYLQKPKEGSRNSKRFTLSHFIHKNRTGWCSGKALGLYSGRSRFESQFGHRISGVRLCYRISPQYTQENSGTIPQLEAVKGNCIMRSFITCTLRQV
jgi:hypothetical protein